jgi:hypothetical protein
MSNGIDNDFNASFFIYKVIEGVWGGKNEKKKGENKQKKG